MRAMTTEGFEVFGGAHLVILGVFALGCVVAVLVGRGVSARSDTVVRRTAGAVILLVCTPFEALDWWAAIGHWRTNLPVQICDFAWLIAGVALLTRSPRWSALLYFWGLTLSLQGVLTPDLAQVYPDPRFFGYWARHLAPVWAALYLVGRGVGPTWRGYRFVLALTAAWAAGMMLLNAWLGSNFGYLNAKPETRSALDLLGPWPWYVLVEAVLVIAGWALITWPWNRRIPTDRVATHETSCARLG